MVWKYVKGWYYDPDAPGHFRKGTAALEDGKVVEAGESIGKYPDGPVIKGLLLPMMPNAHTHLGDFSLRDHVKEGMTVEELVAPPSGLKHRLLPTIDIQESISKALHAMKRAGIGSFCDFREGGVGGVHDIARALTAEGHDLKAMIMGRPLTLSYDKDEVDQLLNLCDGIGVSGMGDWDLDELSELAKHTRGQGKGFALHVSEVEREDIDVALDLDPSFVIHMTHGNKGDLHRLSTFGVPVVVCPRSNMFYGRRPPLKDMVDAGVQVCLGTDNAMMSDLSMFGELKAAREIGLSATEAWGLIESSWKLLNESERMLVDTQGGRLIAIDGVHDDPIELLTTIGSRAGVTIIK